MNASPLRNLVPGALYQNPYPLYAVLREHAPVFWWESCNCWLVSRYADALALLKDPRLGHDESVARGDTSAIGAAAPGAALLAPLWSRMEHSGRLMRLWVLLRNPPDHSRLRNLMQPAFVGTQIKSLHPFMHERAGHLIATMMGSGRVDLMEGLARPLALGIISRLLDIPEEDGARLLQFVRPIAPALDPGATPARLQAGLLMLAELADYFDELLRERRRQPRDSLIDNLVKAHAHGSLSNDELVANCVLLFFAGLGTSSGLLGNACLALLSHSDQYARLSAEPDRIPQAIEEAIRFNSPAQSVPRTAMVNLELQGQRIFAGQQVLLLLGSANRDSSQFDRPDQFDIDRHPNRHLGFGHGLHLCVGAPLARIGARIALTHLVTTQPSLAVAEPPVYEDCFTIREPRTLFVMA